MTLEIVPLDCGHLTQVEQSAHQYFTGFGEKIHAQTILWLIRGGEKTVVLDVGSGTPELVKERFGRELVQSEGQQVGNVCRAAGIEPDEVDVVVQTHLHWDHALSFADNPFPNAEVYLQRSEIAYAAAPYTPHAGLYDPVTIKQLLPVFASELPNIRVIDGDFRLFDGLKIVHLPGHTPGLQGVLVETGGKVYGLGSDTVPYASSWKGRVPQDWIPEGIHVSLEDCYRSMARLAEEADVVLPSHDACVLETSVYGGAS
jgi:glyoxylase-like metal-dependent hydrolase (beta-lactamase superfamily II)